MDAYVKGMRRWGGGEGGKAWERGGEEGEREGEDRERDFSLGREIHREGDGGRRKKRKGAEQINLEKQ